MNQNANKISRSGLINMRVRIHVAYGLIAATYIATVCSILFGCRPMHKNWQINPDPGSMYFHSGPSVLSDLLTLSQITASPLSQRSISM